MNVIKHCACLRSENHRVEICRSLEIENRGQKFLSRSVASYFPYYYYVLCTLMVDCNKCLHSARDDLCNWKTLTLAKKMAEKMLDRVIFEALGRLRETEFTFGKGLIRKIR